MSRCHRRQNSKINQVHGNRWKPGMLMSCEICEDNSRRSWAVLPPGDGYYHCPCHAVRVQPEIKEKGATRLASALSPLTIDNFNSTMSSLFPHPAWISKTSGCWITECLACWWNVLRSCSALWSLVLRGPTDKKGMLLTPWNLNMLNSIYVSRQCIDVSRWKQSFREWVGRVFPFFPKLVKFTSTHACTDFVSQTLHLSVDSDLSRWRRRLGFFCEILRVKSLEPEFSRSVELKALWPSVTAPLGPLTLSALAGELGSGQAAAVLSVAIHCLRMQNIQGASCISGWLSMFHDEILWFHIFSNKLHFYCIYYCIYLRSLGPPGLIGW